MNDVRKKMDYVVKKQLMWAEREKEIQEQCPHENCSEEYKGNSGNYDPTADSYWIEFRCADCDKFWIEEQ